MSNRFQENKAIAVLTYLLELSNDVGDKYWLNKVMYYIERESILQYGEPMFHDDLYSMPYGPVVSSVKNGIDSTDTLRTNTSKWKEYIQLDNDTHAVYLVAPGNYSLLSESETDLIKQAYEKFKDFSFTKIMNYFHNNFPEFEEITGVPHRKPIYYKNLLLKNGFSQEETSEIIDEINYSEKLSEAING